MSPQEMLMTAVLLDQQADAVSRRACNDLSSSVLDVLSESEWIRLCKLFYHYNGDPENFNPSRMDVPYDFVWLSWSAVRLAEQAFSTEPNLVLTHPSPEVRRLAKKVKLLKERTKGLDC